MRAFLAAFVVLLCAGPALSADADRYLLRPDALDARPEVGLTEEGRLTASIALNPGCSTFIVTYNGLPPAAEAAFQYAVDNLSYLVSSDVPIRVNVNWFLGGGSPIGAGPIAAWRDQAGMVPNTWYVESLADKLSGLDTSGGALFDIGANVNGNVNWYLGTDGNPPPGQLDLVTHATRELIQGLGQYSLTVESGGTGFVRLVGSPIIYDRFVENGAGVSMLSPADPSAALGAFLTSGDLFFDGPNANAANGGARPPLHAPFTFEIGDSVALLHEAAFPQGNASSLMTPVLAPGEAINHPGPVGAGIMRDIGWCLCVPSFTVPFVQVVDPQQVHLLRPNEIWRYFGPGGLLKNTPDLPPWLVVDALDEVATGIYKFSVATTTVVNTGVGVQILHPANVYLWQNGVISLDLDWAAAGIQIANINGLDMVGAFNYLFSVDTLQFVLDGTGSFVILRPSGVYVYNTISGAISQFFDAGPLGFWNVNSVELLPDFSLVISPKTQSFGPGPGGFMPLDPANGYEIKGGINIGEAFKGKEKGLQSINSLSIIREEGI